jgi:serine/threonine-protein phosphatase 2A regulatory subunit B
LWKLEYRYRRQPINNCDIVETGEVGEDVETPELALLLPEHEIVSEAFEGVERKQYKNCHQYNINSMSISSDGEHFLSADDLRIHMWHLDNDNLAYNIVDLKPENIEELSEVITHVEYHPTRPDLFLFTSSKGYMCTCDLRLNSKFDRKNNAQFFMQEEDPSRKNFFSDIVSSVSRGKFS